MKNTGGKMKTRWTAAFCLIMVLLVSLGGMSYAASPPAGTGPQEIQVMERDAGGAVDLNGEVLVLNLESNPSTGYGWQVQGLDSRILRQLDAAEWLPDSQGKLGGTGTQVLRFAAVGEGRATLNLVYARPWETAVAPAKTFSLEVQVNALSRNVTYPQPAAEEPLAAGGDGGSITAVPAAYNWCSLAGCTPVRDQGNCGSCWAFGTVGPLEQAILIKDGVSRDLSEQYLVSCNTDGWSCSGGWWAHDYHEWKYPASEPGPGAVYEADFPYTATNAPCNPPHTHHETIADWVYVGSQYGVPTTAAIKQAIYDHGPVSAAVCVNTAFQLYTGGVFNPLVSCSTMNHAIVLVGWDDSLGAWRLRNSWGDDWGEGGYMWIAYGKNYVGYSANYVVYNGSTPPAAPTNLAATPVSSSQINLTWTDNANNETGFKIERCTGAGCTNFAQIATVGANVTSYANAGLAAATSYSYRVRASSGVGDSDYSNTVSATTYAPPLPPAAPSNLVAAAASYNQINLTWNDNSANEDGFKVERCTGPGCADFAQIATVGADVTSYSNTGLSASTSYSYRVRAYNEGGDSDYSNPASATTAEPPAGAKLYLGSSTSGTAGGVAFADEDVLIKDMGTGAWSLFIDGSDIGLANTDVDAFELQADGSLLMSFDTDFTLSGFGAVDDSDVLRFTPTSTGGTTAGTWSWYFDGSDVGLSTSDEDVDALGLLPDGRLLISTLGNVSVTGASGADEDLLAFTPTTLGATTSGTWAMYFDGSDVGLSSTSNEDVNGVWVDTAGKIYLTTLGNFSVTGVSGDGSDILACTPGSLGSTTTCTWAMYWDGSANGFSGEDTDSVSVIP
jgi:predicted secreted protein